MDFMLRKKCFFLVQALGSSLLDFWGVWFRANRTILGFNNFSYSHLSITLFQSTPPPLGTNCLCMSVKLVVYLLMLSLLVIFLDRKFNQGEKFNGEFGSKEEK